MANIEIDGKKIQARDGSMVIEAADEVGIYIPRFCYHKKLSIAANCRMCLVDVEKAAKPLPACATPVTDGMKIFTKSEKAVAAQKSVMEFLLINHPLDCPICDQGGECELQDIAMGYGSDMSKFTEGKRVVKNKDLGPLISTDMTRCIHCTRCVRFGSEVAGVRELGATGRGEHMEIGTYVKNSVTSELSGNVIDLCPVGALTSKPFRFSARAWELAEHDAVAPHDCLGSNISVHVRNANEVIRVVPRENEEINETWISDRDRFSYEAVNSAERLTRPMIKQKGIWQETDWESALRQVVGGFNKVIVEQGVDQVGALISANCTTEEHFLLQKLMRGLRVANIDHRLRQTDFADQHNAPVFPGLGQPVQELENADAVLLVGSNIRHDQPLAAHRLRKGANSNGTQVMVLNSVDYDFYLPVAHKLLTSPANYVSELAAILKAVLAEKGGSAPEGFDNFASAVEPGEQHKAIAAKLLGGGNSSIILGPMALNHPELSSLRVLAAQIAQLSGSRFGYLSDGGNSAGAWIAGSVPHRQQAGNEAEEMGISAQEMLNKGLKAYFLVNVEPHIDSVYPARALANLKNSQFNVVLSSFVDDTIKEYADVLLPMGAFTETAGTYINAAGQWQSFAGVVKPPGEVRPGWKILRVLGNFFGVNGFDYVQAGDVLAELQGSINHRTLNDNSVRWQCPPAINSANDQIVRVSETQMYAGDSLQRRAKALQDTEVAYEAAIRVNRVMAERLSLRNGGRASVKQSHADSGAVLLPVVLDDAVSDNCVLIHAGVPGSIGLSADLAPLEIST